MNVTHHPDDDLLLAAKEVAAAERRTTGEVLSEWARRGQLPTEYREREEPIFRNGFEVFPPTGRVVTHAMVRRLIDETEDL